MTTPGGVAVLAILNSLTEVFVAALVPNQSAEHSQIVVSTEAARHFHGSVFDAENPTDPAQSCRHVARTQCQLSS